MTNPTETHPCIAYACPFCGADPGTPCIARTSGKEQNWPHSRRLVLKRTAEERDLRASVRVKALCCECGNLRTVNGDYSRYNSPDYSGSWQSSHPQGWQRTESLKCSACGRSTRHAVLRREDRPDLQNADEEWERCARGESSQDWSKPYIERLRDEYRKMPFPQNPNLTHRYLLDEAKRVWDKHGKDGELRALCGTVTTVGWDPKKWGESKKRKRRRDGYDGYAVAEQLSDIEYTDLDTGLEWIDMDCVDCCQVPNEWLVEHRRDRLKWFLQWFALKPAEVPESAVLELNEHLERLWKRASQKPG